jgi:ribosomal protein L29
MVRAGGTVENPARMKGLRRAIAKLLTVEREEELGLRKTKKRKEKKTK